MIGTIQENSERAFLNKIFKGDKAGRAKYYQKLQELDRRWHNWTIGLIFRRLPF